MKGTRRAVTIALALLGAAGAGCVAARDPYRLDSKNPGSKIPAIKLAVEHNDLTASAQLVKDLDSDDPAVRFYASDALHRLTGQDFAYVYYLDRDQRQPAVARWQAWLAQQQSAAGQTAPTTAP